MMKPYVSTSPLINIALKIFGRGITPRIRWIIQLNNGFVLKYLTLLHSFHVSYIGKFQIQTVSNAVEPLRCRIDKTLMTRALLGQYQHARSEEHTSELQSRQYLVCRLLLEKKTTQLHTP